MLAQGKVDYIIGFQPGSLKFTSTPLITSDKDDVEKLVINRFMANNLAVYLTQIKGRIGLTVKGCDSRSVVSLIQDNKVARENLIILGIACRGLLDMTKIELLVNRERDEIGDVIREGDRVVVTVDSNQIVFPIEQVLFNKCIDCEYPTPAEYDILIDEPVTSITETEEVTGRKRIEDLEAMNPRERWQFWRKEFERCIRCYACREICPACYCDRCFVEESEPQWVMPLPRWQDNMMFQIMRNIHLAGKCTDCGECERACPVNIPLRSLSRKIYGLSEELFSYKAGMDITEQPMMTAYETEEAKGVML